MIQKIQSLKTDHRVQVVLVALALFALSGCLDDHGNNDDHHRADQSEGHHGATKGDDHHGDNTNNGHHADTGDSDHHNGGHSSRVGGPGLKADVGRVVKVAMNDLMRFEPANIQVKAGETIQFSLENTGSLKHEMVIGETEELIEHGELMKKFPGMEHEEPNMLSLEAGTSGELLWKFSTAGVVSFACLQSGHYDAGMKGTVTVN